MYAMTERQLRNEHPGMSDLAVRVILNSVRTTTMKRYSHLPEHLRQSKRSPVPEELSTRYRRLKEAKLCVNCMKPSPDRVRCKACHDAMKRRAKLRASGLKVEAWAELNAWKAEVRVGN